MFLYIIDNYPAIIGVLSLVLPPVCFGYLLGKVIFYFKRNAV